MSQLLSDLDALDALLSDESKWTKYTVAEDASGDDCEAYSSRAVCWCLEGAAVHVTVSNWSEFPKSEALREALRDTMGVSNLADWNDAPERTFADIKSLIATTRERVAKQQE
jgi:hypothetical protein